jgi:hypothetical protein
MGWEFIPALVNTVDYDVVRWEFMLDMLDDTFHELLDREDVDVIYDCIKDWSEKFAGKEKEVKERIRDFIGDTTISEGAVAVTDDLYGEVILAIMYRFGR